MSKNSLIICDLNRIPICDLNDNTEYRVRNIIENRETNIITELKFDLPIANPKWVNIINENLVLFKDEYYVIKNPTFNHDEDGKLYVNVLCKHYSNNLAEDLISLEETTPKNVIDLMMMALCYQDGKPTKGWSVGKVTVDRVALRGLEAMEQSPFSVLLTIAEKYNGMLHFNSKTMTVDLLELGDTTRPTIDIRGSKNLKSVSISYDTSEMYTRLYCYGAPDEDDNELDIMSVNPTGKPYIDNYSYFYRLGYTKDFVESHPELFVKTTIWRDSNYYDPQDLYNDGVLELEKIAQPVVDISISALDISTLGEGNNPCNLQIGDCVRIVDEELGLDTLCNVIKREINHEEPHILNITVTNSITYRDTLSKLFTNVNTVSSVVTSGGNIIGSTSMSSVKDYLNTYYINSEQIDAKYVNVDTLDANYLTADEIKTKYLDAESIGATYATIGSLQAIEAQIKDLDVDAINAKIASIEDLTADFADISKLVANEAEIEELKAGNVTIAGKLSASNAEIENLKSIKLDTGEFTAYKATVENLIATKASIEELEANYIKASQIDATYAKITELNAVKGNFETLSADLAKVEKLVVDKADIEDLNAVNATIETLKTDLVKTNELLADKVDAEYVEAEIVEATKVLTDDIEAINATIDTLDVKYATIELLNAKYAELDTLISKKATIEDLTAAVADISELNALVANINSVLAGNIGTGLLQTIHLTADNVVIDDAIIKSAMIESINTDEVTVGNDNIILSGSTQQFKDSNGNVRVQIGQDAEGNFSFVVADEDGATVIDADGVTENAIPDGLIVDKMVADGAGIQASKINYVDKDGNKTLQTVIEVEQGRIETLIKETSIENEDGTTTTLKDAFSQTVETVKGYDTIIYDVETEVDTLSGEIKDMNSQITKIQATADGITTQISEIDMTNRNYIRNSKTMIFENYNFVNNPQVEFVSDELNYLTDDNGDMFIY